MSYRHLCCESSQTQTEWMANIFIAQVWYLFQLSSEVRQLFIGNVSVVVVFKEFSMSLLCILLFSHPWFFKYTRTQIHYSIRWHLLCWGIFFSPAQRLLSLGWHLASRWWNKKEGLVWAFVLQSPTGSVSRKCVLFIFPNFIRG